MNTKKIVIGAVLVIIGLPVALVLIIVASIYVLDRTNGAIVSSDRLFRTAAVSRRFPPATCFRAS
jgi:hypothetical protein